MEYWHHIAQNIHPYTNLYQFIINNGIPHKTTSGLIPKFREKPYGEMIRVEKYLLSFEIAESNPHWGEIKKILEQEGAGNLLYTTSTEEEQRRAPWSWVVTAHEGGYPQPENDYEVYSQNVYCKKCNIYQQKAPYRIKKEFNLGKNYFHRLFWLGEFFAKPDVFRAFQSQGFKGLDAGDVLIHRTNEKSTSLQQICIPTIAPVDISNLGELKELICPVCGRSRYTFCYRGSLRYKASDMKGIDVDFLTVKHWTGNGHMSWHEILFSQRVVNFILDQNWKGIRFLPILFDS